MQICIELSYNKKGSNPTGLLWDTNMAARLFVLGYQYGGRDYWVTALLTLKANWFDTLTVKQWEIMINNDVLLFSATNEKTPYQQLLHYWV